MNMNDLPNHSEGLYKVKGSEDAKFMSCKM